MIIIPWFELSIRESHAAILPIYSSKCAKILSHGLKLSLRPSREYVKEREKDAKGLLELNWKFQKISNLGIASFYETIDYSIGPWHKVCYFLIFFIYILPPHSSSFPDNRGERIRCVRVSQGSLCHCATHPQ